MGYKQFSVCVCMWTICIFTKWYDNYIAADRFLPIHKSILLLIFKKITHVSKRTLRNWSELWSRFNCAENWQPMQTVCVVFWLWSKNFHRRFTQQPVSKVNIFCLFAWIESQRKMQSMMRNTTFAHTTKKTSTVVWVCNIFYLNESSSVICLVFFSSISLSTFFQVFISDFFNLCLALAIGQVETQVVS